MTRVEPEVYVPPMPGATVTRATGKQRDSALYFDEMGDQKVPVGFGRDGQPVYINFEFVDGTRGAHVSISGVSGIATKTSFALFLLHSILNSRRPGCRGAQHQDAGVLGQGRGPALPGLRQLSASPLNSASATTNWDCRRPRSRTSGSLLLPGRATRPARPTWPRGTRPSARSTGRSQEFCEDELLPFVFADAEDERAQYTMLIGQVAARLKRDAVNTGERRRGQDQRRRPGQRQDHPVVRRPRRAARGRARRRLAARQLGRRQRGHRQHQRPAAPAPLGRQAAHRDHPRRPGAPRRAIHHHQRAPRSPSSTCTTCPTGRSGSSSASRCGANSPARSARAPPGR